jgi:hypothetical protein
VFQVPEKRLGFENFDFYFCQVCRLEIRPEDFFNFKTETGSVGCYIRIDYAIHQRCMPDGDLDDWEMIGIWVCNACPQNQI